MKNYLSEFVPQQFISTVVTGLIIGLTGIFYHISIASLIFSGGLSAFLADGIGLILFGGAIVGLVVALFGSLPGTIPAIQDSPAAVFAIAATAILIHMQSTGSTGNIYFTVVAAISFTAILTGIIFLLAGRFGLSSFVRFMPYPVVGGFLAGTGWLLFKGALSVMSGLSMKISDLPSLFTSGQLILWLPGALFGLILILASRRFRHPLLMPAFLLGGIVLFYGILFAAGIPVAEASSRGLLLGAFPQKALWRPLQFSALSMVDWQAILPQTGKLVSIMALSTIALLLNANGLELATHKDIDLDRELMTAGLGNILGGLGGSPVGYQTIGMSALAHRMGGGSRLTTLISTALLGAALFFGAALLSYFPKALLGGLLFYLGLSFLVEWVYDAARRLPILDYLLVLVILVIVAAVGFLEGVIAGTIFAVILFVVNYSRVQIIKDVLTGKTYQSRKERPIEHRQLLEDSGRGILILRLQGYLFFGTAQGLLNRFRDRIHDPKEERLRFLILDFQHVSSLDTSAVVSFTRMYQLCETNHIYLVATTLSPKIQELLNQGGLLEGEDKYFKIFPSMDYGAEWCENRLLSEDTRSGIFKAATLQGQLKKILSSPDQIERFMKYLERLEFDESHELINQGDLADALYLVDSGQVSAQLEVEPGRFVRLRSMGGGTVVGEVGLYLKEKRTASIITDTHSVVYRLSEGSLARMEQEDPQLASVFHHWMVRMLAERLANNNRTLEALLN
ncbi:MAG: hypothetical protein A2Y54_02870 [Chloroflexi bacterium RBG_16_51_16]|nr:MAG: hypothetical protein A2Y54_02870 [Chloroflexi bacterium RBG_16_51_16]